MTKQQLIALLFLLVVTIVAVLFIVMRPTSPSVAITDSEEERFTDATVVQYVDGQGQSVSVAYVGDLARITGGAYDGVTLRQVISASGAKYEGETGLSLWTKNNEVRIETPQAVVYQGTAIETPEVPETPPEVIVTEDQNGTSTATTTSVLIPGVVDVTWVWQQADLVSGEVVTPNKPEAFSLTLTSTGEARGATDCNGFGGNYSVAAERQVSFGEFMSTLMFCDGSQEQVFRDLLVQGISIETVTDTELAVTNTAGDTIRFTKARN